MPIDGAVRFFEGAGARGALELVGEELLALLRGGTPPEKIGIVCPSVDRWRAPLETALGTLGIPFAVDGEVRLDQTRVRPRADSLLRFAWLGGPRLELFTFLRSPFSGLERRAVDFVEGRLRGRAVQTPERVVEEAEKLRGAPFPALAELAEAADPVEAVRALAARMLRNAYGLERRRSARASRLDLRAYQTVSRLLERARPLALARRRALARGRRGALERQTLRPFRGDERAGSRCSTSPARARGGSTSSSCSASRRAACRGAERPRRSSTTTRAVCSTSAARGCSGPTPVSRDRYLFYTACTRPLERLYLVREAATDDGSPREPSPFWDEVQAAFDPEDVRRWTRRRPLSALTWSLEDAPTDRERLRALAELAARDRAGADALARANGVGAAPRARASARSSGRRG